MGHDDVDGPVEVFDEDSGGEEEGGYDSGNAGGVHGFGDGSVGVGVDYGKGGGLGGEVGLVVDKGGDRFLNVGGGFGDLEEGEGRVDSKVIVVVGGGDICGICGGNIGFLCRRKNSRHFP